MLANFRSNTVTKKTRSSYSNSSCRFLAWLVKNEPQLITETFYSELGNINDLDSEQLKQRIKQTLRNDVEFPPIEFLVLTPETVLTWLNSLRHSDGTALSNSAYGLHRSALTNLFRDFDFQPTQAFTSKLNLLFKGFRRVNATQVATFGKRIKIGKDPLPFDFYTFLNRVMLKIGTKDMTFARTFLVLSWNLMSRSANTVKIRFPHMEWRGDAMQIFFAPQKTDQFGERPRDGRHIYCNPFIPEICPVLALGLYWTTLEFSSEESLFPGESQYDRYRKILKRLLQFDEVREELLRRGINSEAFGSHSARKGAATFASSGNTSCPPNAAIQLRAGWKMGGVQDRYVRFEAAGDQFVGRTVAGLPLGEAEFSILPPHFVKIDDDVNACLKKVFPNLPENLNYIGEFTLASLVFHSSWIRQNVSKKHQIFSSPLFVESNQVC